MDEKHMHGVMNDIKWIMFNGLQGYCVRPIKTGRINAKLGAEASNSIAICGPPPFRCEICNMSLPPILLYNETCLKQ